MPEAVRGHKIQVTMDINVKVTIGLAQHVQDIAQALIERITRPAELPARSTASNEIPAVAVARTPEVVSTPQPKQEVEHEVKEVKEVQDVQEPEQAPSDVVSVAKVREKVAELIPMGFRAKIQEILQNDYGVTGYGQLQGEELTEFYQKIKEL